MSGVADQPTFGRLHELILSLGIELSPQRFEHALTHRSYAYENEGVLDNERLEFLGDAVLGVVVAEYLYRTYPDFPEGMLAKLRAAVVNSHSLAGVARQYELGSALRLGKGEIATGGADKTSLLADALEAILGAVLLDAGREAADRLVHHLFDPLVRQAAELGAGLDWKTSLQELAAERSLGSPAYQVSESGPDHEKRFEAVVVLGQSEFAPGNGSSKKQAEQSAARLAFLELSAD